MARLWLKLAQQLAISTPINDSGRLPAAVQDDRRRACAPMALPRRAPDEAAALLIAGQGFAKRENWRPALLAYKESLKLVEVAEVRADL